MVALLLICTVGIDTGVRAMDPGKPSEWVGDYSYSTGFTGLSLKLNKDKTFSSSFSQDVYGAGIENPRRRGGEWELKGELIIVKETGRQTDLVTSQYIPVRWSGAKYLVNEGSIDAFIRQVQKERKPNNDGKRIYYLHQSFLRSGRTDDPKDPVSVPKGFLDKFKALN